ncbi:DUF2243 domain-containing protein [Bordetella hinzii]|uniref:DUF2243 domain-containing protein n=1 Tax=Bordetella hinzii TaxID=103855 RepID=UPI002B46448F|nr:DUF2243 domain-containing protein [Bordetella hinzii]
MDAIMTPDERRLRRASGWLGFAMGGFFDGILLHQILQWHHLLSALRTGVLADLRMQVAVDGLFHALMYAVAAVGLWMLYRARRGDAAIRPPWPAFWMGFGVWHIVDALFSHWITGIHRIRMDSGMPLFWDVLWLAVFGLLPFFLGWRGRGGSQPVSAARRQRHHRGGIVAAGFGCRTVAGAGWHGGAGRMDGPRRRSLGLAGSVLAPKPGALPRGRALCQRGRRARGLRGLAATGPAAGLSGRRS